MREIKMSKFIELNYAYLQRDNMYVSRNHFTIVFFGLQSTNTASLFNDLQYNLQVHHPNALRR